GQEAMKHLLFDKYNPNTTVAHAIDVWTNNKPYDRSLTKGISDKKLGDLSPEQKTQLLNAITQGEDSTEYNWTNPDGTPIARTPATPKEPPVDPNAFNTVEDH